MATQADVRRIALSWPAAEQVAVRFAFAVRRKGKLKEIRLAHFQGCRGVPVRLPAVTAREPEPIITEACRCQASRDLTLTIAPRRRAVARKR